MRKFAPILSLLMLFSSLAFGSLKIKTDYKVNSLQEFDHLFKKLVSAAKKEDVLVIFDIDHTLLRPHGQVGSSYWFKWQSALLKTPATEPEQIAQTPAELDRLTCKVFEVVPFEVIEPRTKQIVETLMQSGFSTLLLTARSPELKHGTLKQFQDAGFDLTKDLLNAPELRPQVYLTFDEKKAVNISNQKPTSYDPKGLLMTNEQDKGAFLKAYLRRSQYLTQLQTIVFIDDSAKNIASVQNAFATENQIRLLTFLYTKEHAKFENFTSTDQQNAAKEFAKIKTKLADPSLDFVCP